MKTRAALLFALILPSLLCAQPAQVLVTIGQEQITAKDLQSAVASSPFADQFTTVDPDAQAEMRGSLLKHLVTAKLLYLEAKRKGLDQAPALQAEVKEHELGLLYRAYLERLRESITLTPDESKQILAEYGSNRDSLAAAKAQLMAERYKTKRLIATQYLKEKYKLQVKLELITPHTQPMQILASSTKYQLRLMDLGLNKGEMGEVELVKQTVLDRSELHLLAQAARDEGISVSRELEDYKNEKLASFLLSQLESTWIPNEQVLKQHFAQHPEIGYLPEVRHVGQIVLASEAEAKQVQSRIAQGESLFRLAGELSIDPYGRGKAGDMGWLKEGTGMPEIEKALKGLADKQISPIIKTAKGYHLVMILERKKSSQKSYKEIQDRVRQAVISQKLAAYAAGLEQQYQVQWQVLEGKP